MFYEKYKENCLNKFYSILIKIVIYKYNFKYKYNFISFKQFE